MIPSELAALRAEISDFTTSPSRTKIAAGAGISRRMA
jgi:hypothetical protein